MKTTLVLSFFLLVMCNNLTLAQSLNGNYTIGGNSPDYQTINEAVDSLELNGISGPVTFNIRPGIYYEQIEINSYPNLSNSNLVVFKSETNNKSDVIIEYTTTQYTTRDYTLFIDGADNLEFKHLTFQREEESYYNRVVYVTGDANNILFDHNTFKTDMSTSSDFEYKDCIVVGGDYNTSMSNDTIIFSNNTIIGGYNGIYLQGSTGTTFTADNWQLYNNEFFNQKRNGLYVVNGKNVSITNNYIKSDITTSFRGIYAYRGIESLLISGNKLILPSKSIGIDVYNAQGSAVDTPKVINNLISIGPNSVDNLTIGIKSSDSDSLLIAYNSINIFSSDSAGHCIETSNSDILTVKNNIFNHSGGGLCILSNNNTSGIFNSNYNNYFNNNNLVAQFDGVNYNSLSELSSSLGIDQNSVSANPFFLNDTILIPYNTSVFDIGDPIPSITYDFYGNMRSNLAPDLGIFEGDVPLVDAGVSNSSLMEFKGCPETSVPLYITLKNFGLNALTSAIISFENTDLTISQINWTGNLSQMEEEEIFVGYVNYEYLQNTQVKVWTSNPNAQTDEFSQNDTLHIPIISLLKGSYTIGGAMADYETINEAIEQLIILGVCDSVIFNINPGTYNESLTLPQIAGVDSVNTVTFQSTIQDSTSVIITSEEDVFYFDNTNHIFIKYLTIKPSQNAIGIHITQNSSNLIISNNLITSEDNCRLIYLRKGHNNTITNNYFVDGNLQIEIEGFNSFDIYEIDILNNVFTGASGHTIDSDRDNGVDIIGNIFKGTNPGLLMDLSSYAEIRVLNNQFLVPDSYLNISSPTDSPHRKIIFKNNFVRSQLSLTNADTLIIIHNSFDTDDKTISFSLLYGGNYIEMKNNIFQSKGDDYIFKFNNYISPLNISSDYNIFNISNGTLAHEQQQYESEYTLFSFDEWRSSTGQDSNSIFAHITFLNDSNLHTNSPIALNAGIYLPGEDFDIDHQARSITLPDIGADEFEIDSLTYTDVAINFVNPTTEFNCLNSDSIAIEIANLSALSIDSVHIKWKLFDTEKRDSFIVHNIAPHDTIIVFVDTYNFRQRTKYKITVEVYYPNGITDNNTNDNTIVKQYYYIDEFDIIKKQNSRCNTEIELFVPKFPRESILWSTGSTESRITLTTTGTYSVTVTDENGCSVSKSITIN